VRTGFETGNVDTVLDGELKPFLKSFLMMSGQSKNSNEL
jgi:peptide chain release factor 2